ncbi:hypothetical protein [Bacillus sp. FSL K6-3431]|uniref:hypothetical protein n=1 Tax=Bacillus sp. FSL K6-3431 TaxID=2921500 RepID=UPI0030FCD931
MVKRVGSLSTVSTMFYVNDASRRTIKSENLIFDSVFNRNKPNSLIFAINCP